MSRLFISHSSRNDDWAIALRDWLVREGWSGENDVFLDLDPERGIAAGERWARALEDAATRCEAVLYLVSEAWLGSKWCVEEYQLAKELNKKLFALLIDDVPLDRLPGGLTAQWQVVHLKGEPAERFLTVHPRTQEQSPVRMAGSGLASLKRGLEKAGIGAETFQLQPDKNGPFGWRAVYRGLEALEPQDAAVFFGRNADLVRGIDALRGLAARKPPRLLVILGASGAGKSSFLRAGLWPRLLRDDSQWLPLRAIRASRGGALEDDEGLLAALEDVHARLALRTTRAALREAITTPERFIALLQDQRQAAARRAHLDQPPYPLPVLCFDQCEELFAAEAGHESAKLLALARAAIEADAALLLVTIRSDAYGLMQSAAALAGIDQVALPLGPVPQGEIGRIIREPSEVLRGQAGPRAPAFEPAVVEQLQKEVAGEPDALPLLAFVLQRLMRERLGQTVIGLKELEQTGGVAAAIEREAEAALADAGYGQGRAGQRDVLRRLFIPRLVRIDRKSKAPQRRVAWQSDLPADLASLARALTERRLLVARVADAVERGEAGPATLEVAHEAMLRRWQTLADLLAEDRDALLMLDGVLTAANDWEKADDNRKPDFLAHRGSRLADAQALAGRGPDWARENAQAQAYLASCQEREKAEQDEREAALAREQARLAEITAAQARTARFQRQARWTLVTLAAAVTAALGVGVWQYLGNMRTMRDLIAAQEKTARGQAELQLAQAETADRQAQVDRAQAEIARGQAELEVARAETARRQAQVERGQVSLLAELATSRRLQGDTGPALRLSVHAVRLASHQGRDKAAGPLATAALVLASSVWQAQWRLQLGGHEALVNSVAFSADGTRIVTASEDGTARLWDAATGREVLVLRRRASYLRSAAFSPDGARIVAASGDLTARIWDAATGREVTVLRRHDDAVFSAAFSPDGERIVTASWDKTARLWDAATGRGLAVLRGHEGGVTSAAFSPDGGRIVTASVDKTARLWDAATGREVTVLRGHEGTVLSAAFSPDGARIVTASGDRTARLWDVATRREVAVLRGHEDRVASAAFSPDGARIVTASEDRTARLWDAATGRELAVLRGHEDGVQSAAFSPDGARIVTVSGDKTGRIWDAATGRDVTVLRGHESPVRSAAFSPDAARIVTVLRDRTARIWDAATGREVTVLRGHEAVLTSAAFSPDGARIVTASGDRAARLWEAATGRDVAVLRGHENAVWSAAFSPDGARVVTASEDRTARLWDAATGRELAVLRGHAGSVHSAAFSADGARIVTASEDRTARIWHAATGRELAVLRGHEGTVLSAAFSPDGARIVTASGDRTARLWDVATRREVAVLRGHEDRVASAAFSPDGARIVTASEDRTARLWDAATGRELAVLRGHEDGVQSAAFSPDGARIVTASWDKTARIWDVRYATMPVAGLIEEVCQRRLLGLTTLTRDEMRLAGYPDDTAPIDVCAAPK